MSAIILINPKYPHNVAAAIRACSCFGVEDLVWTGERVNPAEYTRLPREERMKGYRDVRWRQHDRPIDFFPSSYTPVCIELVPNAQNLVEFVHPEKALYVFGPEDGSVPQVIRRLCHHFVSIPSHHCLNLSAALNVVLYDRRSKEPQLPLSEILHETRGELAQVGWDGK